MRELQPNFESVLIEETVELKDNMKVIGLVVAILAILCIFRKMQLDIKQNRANNYTAVNGEANAMI